MGETQAPPLRLPPKEASPPSPFGPLGVSALDACDESQSLPLALTPRYAAHLSSPRRHSPPGMLKLRLPDVPFQSIDLQLPRDTLSPLLPLLDTGRPTTSSGFTHAANRMFEETRRFLESAESDGVDSMRPISSQPDGGGKTGWNPRSTCLHRPLACLSSEDHRELFDKQWKEVHSLYESRPWRGEIVHSPVEPSAPTLPRVPTPPLLPKAARYIPASAKRGPVGGFNGREMKPRKPRNDSAREILSKIERLRRNEQEFLAFQEEVQVMMKERTPGVNLVDVNAATIAERCSPRAMQEQQRARSEINRARIEQARQRVLRLQEQREAVISSGLSRHDERVKKREILEARTKLIVSQQHWFTWLALGARCGLLGRVMVESRRRFLVQKSVVKLQATWRGVLFARHTKALALSKDTIRRHLWRAKLALRTMMKRRAAECISQVLRRSAAHGAGFSSVKAFLTKVKFCQRLFRRRQALITRQTQLLVITCSNRRDRNARLPSNAPDPSKERRQSQAPQQLAAQHALERAAREAVYARRREQAVREREHHCLLQAFAIATEIGSMLPATQSTRLQFYEGHRGSFLCRLFWGAIKIQRVARRRLVARRAGAHLQLRLSLDVMYESVLKKAVQRRKAIEQAHGVGGVREGKKVVLSCLDAVARHRRARRDARAMNLMNSWLMEWQTSSPRLLSADIFQVTYRTLFCTGRRAAVSIHRELVATAPSKGGHISASQTRPPRAVVWTARQLLLAPDIFPPFPKVSTYFSDGEVTQVLDRARALCG